MNKFCPKCGTEKGPFIDGFCIKCYLEDHKLIILPDRLELQRCKKCGKVLINRRWVANSADNIATFVLNKVRWANLNDKAIDIKVEHERHGINVILTASGKIKGIPVSAQYRTFISYKNQLCDTCLKLSSSYHEAVVQIRYSAYKENNAILPYAKRFMNAMQNRDPLAKVVKTDRVKTGIDLFIGSNRAARQLVKGLKKRFNASVKQTSTLTGITKAGKKVRYTYMVKVP